MILHYAQNSRAVRVAWLLEEIEQPYKIIKYELGEKRMREEKFLRINPLGRVPVLEDDNIKLTESGAIIQYILTKYGTKHLIPSTKSEEYPNYLQWFHFAEGMIMPQMNIIVVETILLPPERRNDENVKRATKLLGRMLDSVEVHMQSRSFLSNEFSAADIMTGHAVVMSKRLGVDFTNKPNLDRYVSKIQARTAFKKASCL